MSADAAGATVALRGELVCATEVEAALVERLLPAHIALTRAEDGCLSFEVTRVGESLGWRVEELFVDAAAFRRHQDRAARSDWGRETGGIERRYVVSGLESAG